MRIDFIYVQDEQKRFLEHLKHVENSKYEDDKFQVPMWITLAIISELIEVLNETKVHKWWDKVLVDRNKVLEEMSDVLSHLGNLANLLEVELDLDIKDVEVTVPETTFTRLIYRIATLGLNKRIARRSLINNLIPLYVELLYSLNFNLDDLKKAYKKKMEINYKRF